MTISNSSTDFPEEVDVIIAGGGTAACVVAGRLAKADPSLQILVIESGINQRDKPEVVLPGIYVANLVPTTNTATFYQAKKSKDLNDREVIVPMGGCLGGGSSINFMMYTRAQGIDFDSWKTEGWYKDDLVPLLKKTETFHSDNDKFDMSIHGTEGPIHVSRSGWDDEVFIDEYAKASAKMGWPECVDNQDLKTTNHCSRWMKWINPNTGRRSDAAHCFVHPILDKGDTGLKVLCEHKVVRVLFEGKKAVGVEFVPNKKMEEVINLTKTVQDPKVVKARKMVIVSSGALGSPMILERSGVGDKKLLEKIGINVVADVPAVGNHYQDHNLSLTTYTSSRPAEYTVDSLLSGRLTMEKAMEQLGSNNNRGVLAWNGIDIASKVRPTDEEAKALGPEFSKLWDEVYKDHPDRPIMLLGGVSGFLGDHKDMKPNQHMAMAYYTAYPISKGSIHITGKKLDDPYDFEPGFFKRIEDVKMQHWAYKKQREISRRIPSVIGPLEGAPHPNFPEGSKLREWNPTTGDDMEEYTEADDKAVEDHLRNNVQTTWHSCGTIPMRPLDQDGALDGRLNVHGTENLKVIDLSIIPENVGANTNSTALLVGEKGAMLVGEDLGIKM